jgi:RNA polymerase sigma-70 factor (ECF subfamily)
MGESDLAAIARVKAGDGEGFRTLVDRHSRSVFRLAYRMTGNEADAEDVVQETFLRAYRQLSSYEERANFSTWLYRIAANYALDMIRSKRRQVEQQSPQDEQGRDMFDHVAADVPAQDRLLFNAEIRRRFDRAMRELTDQERAAFEMRHFEGLSIEEIGSVLDLGGSATKNSIFRAVRKLRGALGPLVGASASACVASFAVARLLEAVWTSI